MRIGEGDWPEHTGGSRGLFGVGVVVTDSFNVSSEYTLGTLGRAVTLLRRELRADNDNCDNDSTEVGRSGRETLSGDTSIDPRRLMFFGVK